MTFQQLSKTQFSSNVLHLHGGVDSSEHRSVAAGGGHHEPEIHGYFFFFFFYYGSLFFWLFVHTQTDF